MSEYQFGRKTFTTTSAGAVASSRSAAGTWTRLGAFYAINIACLDGVADEELAQAPIQYENGRNDDYDSPPAETRHL